MEDMACLYLRVAWRQVGLEVLQTVACLGIPWVVESEVRPFLAAAALDLVDLRPRTSL